VGKDRPRTVVAWSSGKDNAYAFHTVLQSEAIEIVGLLTTLSEAFNRVSMHDVRKKLPDRQFVDQGSFAFTDVVPLGSQSERLFEPS
jgi:glutaminase